MSVLDTLQLIKRKVKKKKHTRHLCSLEHEFTFLAFLQGREKILGHILHSVIHLLLFSSSFYFETLAARDNRTTRQWQAVCYAFAFAFVAVPSKTLGLELPISLEATTENENSGEIILEYEHYLQPSVSRIYFFFFSYTFFLRFSF